MSTYDYQQLRVKVGFGDDADFAGTQVAPADLVTIAPQKDSIENVQVELLIEWLDPADVVQPGRGAFTIHVVRVIDREPAAGQVVVDSVALTASGYRAVLIDDTRAGDLMGVRLTAITPPGGTETKMRVLYKEGVE